MSGTTIGGIKAAKTNKKKYGNDFYKKVGAKGGSRRVPKGFAMNPELARIAGAKGGKAKTPKGFAVSAELVEKAQALRRQKRQEREQEKQQNAKLKLSELTEKIIRKFEL